MAKSLKRIVQKKSPKQSTRFVGLRMPEDLENEIAAIAKKNDESVSQVILRALRIALEMEPKKVRGQD